MKHMKRLLAILLTVLMLLGIASLGVLQTTAANSYPKISALNMSRVYQSDSSASQCTWCSMATVQGYCLGEYTYGGKTTSYRVPGNEYEYGAAKGKRDAVTEYLRNTFNTFYNNASTLKKYPFPMEMKEEPGADVYELIYNQLKAGKPVIVYRKARNKNDSNHASVVIAYNGSDSKLEPSGFTVMEINRNVAKNSAALFEKYANNPQTKYSTSCYIKLSTWLDGRKVLHIIYPKAETISAAKTLTVTLRDTSHIETNAATVHLTAWNPEKKLVTARGVQVKKKGASSWAKTYSEDLSKKTYNKDTVITGYFDIGSGKEVNYVLSAGTTYEYRCFVTSGGKNYYSNVSTFTTKKATTSAVKMPSVTLRATTDITTSSAMVHMTVSNPSKLLITARGTQIRKPGATEWAKTFTEDLSKKDYNRDKSITGAFTFGDGKEVDYSLSAGTKYEFRCFCTYNGQNYYSKASTFTTKKDAASTVKMPSVTLRATTDITTSSAMVHMTVSNPSKLLITARGTQIRKPGATEWAKTFTEDLSKKDYNKDKSITGAFTFGSGKEVDYALSAGTKYEFRCFCTYNGQNYYSKASTFTTKKATTSTVKMPSVTLRATTDITTSSAMVHMTVSNPSKLLITARGTQIRRPGASEWEKTFTEDLSKKDYNKDKSITGAFTFGSGKEVDYTLSPGMTYEYRCFCTYNGNNYYSKTSSFKTTDTSSYKYTVKYNANGGKGTMASMTVAKDTDFTLPETQFTKAGYTFAGWTVKRSSDSKWYVPNEGWKTTKEINDNGWSKKVYESGNEYRFNAGWINGTKTSDTYTFYAVWKACEHEWNEGIVTKEPTISATGVMTFTCEICGKTKTEKIPKISTYQVKFNANGGKGTVAAMKVEKEDDFTLPENQFTKVGYTFIGWTVKRSSDSKWLVEDNDWQTNSEIKANGSEKMIFDEEADLALDEDWINGSKSTDTYTFYAVWEKDI